MNPQDNYYKEIDDFNERWIKHLEPGFEGLSFNDNNNYIVDYLDTVFSKLDKTYPEFTYTQIKIKFGTSRAYIHGIPYPYCAEIESNLDKILKNA